MKKFLPLCICMLILIYSSNLNYSNIYGEYENNLEICSYCSIPKISRCYICTNIYSNDIKICPLCDNPNDIFCSSCSDGYGDAGWTYDFDDYRNEYIINKDRTVTLEISIIWKRNLDEYGRLVIPDTVNGMKVTAIDTYSNNGQGPICVDYVVLNNNLTRIDGFSFWYKKPKQVYIPESVNYISDTAFWFPNLLYDSWSSISTTLYVEKDSYAEQWAIEHNYPYSLEKSPQLFPLSTITNFDYKYKTSDLIRLAKYISGKISYNDAITPMVATFAESDKDMQPTLDLNGDGVVNSEDLLYMIKILIGDIII